jgi:chemotaxis protein methyltransferase WspC
MIDNSIEELLLREIGLVSSSVGLATIEAAVRCRMTECKINDRHAYFNRLISRRTELDSLIDEVTVPETWFFRDKEPFAFLMSYVTKKWSWEKRNQPLRVLSVPCSSGEEPYSIAISLMEAGISEEMICLDAVDINRRALGKARNGVYGQNSFRDSTFHRFIHYFQSLPKNEYSVRNNLLRVVNFIHGNILKNNFLADRAPYDIIFCRNLLIYMDVEARQSILRTLSKLLKQDGLLFVGHAEALPIVNAVFNPLRENGAFVYCNSKSKLECIPPRSNYVAPRPHADSTVAETLSLFPAKVPSKRKPDSAGGKTMGLHDESLLAKAQQLANDGQHREAEGICHTHIEKYPLSAQAFFILGIIAQAKGDLTLAEDQLQKVIYLDPEHEQALQHLAFIYDDCGDLEKAQDIRRRRKKMGKSTPNL